MQALVKIFIYTIPSPAFRKRNNLDKKSFIKNMLAAFLPILIFVGADEYLSHHFPEAQATQYALILAITMGLAQMIYIFIKERRLDKMLIMDTSLIVLLGGISLLSGSDIFFKLKPAIIQLIMVVLLGFMAFMKPEMLMAMTQRMTPGIDTPEAQKKAMQKSAKGLVIGLFLHSLLIVYSAFYMSRASWAFISGPLLYIACGIYFAGLFLYGKFRQGRSNLR